MVKSLNFSILYIENQPKTMEKRYKSLSIFEFQKRFPDEEACLDHLEQLKWAKGFVCDKCGHTHYCKGKTKRSRQCTRCRYQASPTSGTLFHKVKFPLQKAFYIIYFMATNKKGISSTELSRKLDLRQKTCWAFHKKVAQAMASSQTYPLQGLVEVDETVVGQQEEEVSGRENGKKKLVVVAIEKQNKGVSRMYAKVIERASADHLRPFFQAHISPEARVKTDLWKGYTPLRDEFPQLEQQESGKKGENFPDMHRVIMMFKAWLRGMHHSVDHLQDYINEYTYRFNRSQMKEGIFDNLMNRVVNHTPVFV